MENNTTSSDNMTPPQKLSTIVGLSFGVIGTIAVTVMLLTGNADFSELGLSDINLLQKLLVLIGLFIAYFFAGSFLIIILFKPSFVAYEKNLKDKKQIFLINCLTFWTFIVPMIQLLQVQGKNSIIDED